MAGRGRGRGRGFSFNLEQLGLSKNEVLPKPIHQQQPLQKFPLLLYNPVPLASDAKQQYLLRMKRVLARATLDSPFCVRVPAPKKDIQRYTDKYQLSAIVNDRKLKFMDQSRFPRDLRPLKRKASSKLPSSTKKRSKPSHPSVDIEKTLEALEGKETKEDDEVEDNEGKAKNDDDEEGADLEDADYYDEEEMEEGTDYNFSYFDNGEEYADDEDDNLDDGPVY